MRSKYSETLKGQMVRRLVGPNAISATQLAREVGISQATLSRWLHRSGSVRAVTTTTTGDQDTATEAAAEARRPQDWPAADRLAVVLEARSVAEADLGAFLRRKGLHEADLDAWRRIALEGAETALAAHGTGKRANGSEDKRVKELERELRELQNDLRRKEKALAEVAALLVLKKKVDLLHKGADAVEPGRNGK